MSPVSKGTINFIDEAKSLNIKFIDCHIRQLADGAIENQPLIGL